MYIYKCWAMKYSSDDLHVLHLLPLSFKPTAFYLCSKVTRMTLEAHPSPTQLVLGVISLAVEWLGDEDDQSPPSNAYVKNALNYPICHHGTVFTE